MKNSLESIQFSQYTENFADKSVWSKIGQKSLKNVFHLKITCENSV